jgi:hypothetical protein
MTQLPARLLALPCALLLAHCSDTSQREGGGAGDVRGARIETRFSAAAAASERIDTKFRAGAANASGLTSLKYQIASIMICESLDTSGSGFQNPQGCLQLYSHDNPSFHYDPRGDWTSLADSARATEDGFVDLLDARSREQLASSTKLSREQARSYNFGIITWSLPIKLTATLKMNGGGYLYTHDGHTQFETVGVDSFRSYFTTPATALDQAPAEEAVVLLGNGGNWFKFQSPFVISAADIEAERAFVLDLVFNPDGIVKGFSDSFAQGSLSQRAASGAHVHDITVPMLDLAPVPHRATEQVMRESYQGSITLERNAFDVRIELYYVEGDANETVYGVDVKSLVNADTTTMPPELSKVSYLERAADGSLIMSSYSHAPIMTGLSRVTDVLGRTQVKLACATHMSGRPEDGSFALIVDRCPSAQLTVDLALVSRTPVLGSVAAGVGEGIVEDAGVEGGI